jgi:hypothetical protein
MFKEDILAFLRSGQLSNFPMGTELKAILNELGENRGWTLPISRKDKRPALIKYGQVEFYFTASEFQKLSGVQITYTSKADSRLFILDCGELKGDLDCDVVKSYLTDNKIAFTEAISSGEKDSLLLTTEGQVDLIFSDSNGLEKIGRFLKVEDLIR